MGCERIDSLLARIVKGNAGRTGRPRSGNPLREDALPHVRDGWMAAHFRSVEVQKRSAPTGALLFALSCPLLD